MATSDQKGSIRLEDQPQRVLDAGAKLAYKNAQRHLKAAHLLSEARDYGNGKAHLVLAAEESMKAYLLVAYRNRDILGIDQPERMLKAVFRRHDVKQTSFAIIALILEWVSNFVELMDTNHENAVERHIHWTEFQVKSEKSITARIQKQLKEMNNFKNDGLYLGFGDGDWKDPGKISKFDYLELEKAVTRYVSPIKRILSLSDKEWADYRERLRSVLKARQPSSESSNMKGDNT